MINGTYYCLVVITFVLKLLSSVRCFQPHLTFIISKWAGLGPKQVTESTGNQPASSTRIEWVVKNNQADYSHPMQKINRRPRQGYHLLEKTLRYSWKLRKANKWTFEVRLWAHKHCGCMNDNVGHLLGPSLWCRQERLSLNFVQTFMKPTRWSLMTFLLMLPCSVNFDWKFKLSFVTL